MSWTSDRDRRGVRPRGKVSKKSHHPTLAIPVLRNSPVRFTPLLLFHSCARSDIHCRHARIPHGYTDIVTAPAPRRIVGVCHSSLMRPICGERRPLEPKTLTRLPTLPRLARLSGGRSLGRRARLSRCALSNSFCTSGGGNCAGIADSRLDELENDGRSAVGESLPPPGPMISSTWSRALDTWKLPPGVRCRIWLGASVCGKSAPSSASSAASRAAFLALREIERCSSI